MQSGRRACPRYFFWDSGTRDKTETNGMFFKYRGTAGQEGLNILDTTIKCPTKVSHFWDERDIWDKRLECKLQLVFGAERRTS